MIKVDYREIEIENGLESIIKDKMSENTCKTNISSQLLFKQSYTGITNKLFVGNWAVNGFWISKFRYQLIDLRPDIIARFSFYKENSSEKIKIRYSIGFSSIFYGLMWMLVFTMIFIPLGIVGFFIGLSIFFGLYTLIASMELKRLKRKIEEKLLNAEK